MNGTDLCSNHHDFGHGSAFEHHRQYRQEVIDPYAMEAELLVGQVHVGAVQTVHTADLAAGLNSINNHHLAAVIEITEGAQARGPGVKYPCLRGETAHGTKPLKHVHAESVISLPEIAKAHDVQHGCTTSLTRAETCAFCRSSQSAPYRRDRHRVSGPRGTIQ